MTYSGSVVELVSSENLILYKHCQGEPGEVKHCKQGIHPLCTSFMLVLPAQVFFVYATCMYSSFVLSVLRPNILDPYDKYHITLTSIQDQTPLYTTQEMAYLCHEV